MACGTLNCRFRHSCRKINTKEMINPDECPEFLKYEDYTWDEESGDPDDERRDELAEDLF